MRSARTVVLPLLGLFFAAGVVRAQGPTLNSMIASREIQFHIFDGRLIFRESSIGPRVYATGKLESLRTSPEKGQYRLDYNSTNAHESLRMELSGYRQSANLTSVINAPRGKPATTVEYTQAADDKVELSVTIGDKKLVFRAADLWQLAISHPKECKQYLTPLLLKLRPGKSLTDASARVEAKLLTLAGDDMTARRVRWAKLVEQLGDEQFGKRQVADRALRGEGSAVLGYLRRFDFRRLDAEQQFRIRRILDSLAGHEDDSVEVAAATLAEEPMVWLILLGRPEEPVRQTAVRQLAMLLGQRIDVDPAANPQTQKEKRNRLRARIEGGSRD